MLLVDKRGGGFFRLIGCHIIGTKYSLRMLALHLMLKEFGDFVWLARLLYIFYKDGSNFKRFPRITWQLRPIRLLLVEIWKLS